MIQWAKKVSPGLIRRLYESDVRGIPDTVLADEVGWALCARCESIISVTYGFELKMILCPRCGSEIHISDGVFGCTCGFLATWEEFRASYKGKQLYGANALPFFLRFRSEFPCAQTFGEKMTAIDTLLHSFHVLHSFRSGIESPDFYDESAPLGRPAAANLIEGTLGEVTEFLDALSSVSGLGENEKALRRNAFLRANGGHKIH